MCVCVCVCVCVLFVCLFVCGFFLRFFFFLSFFFSIFFSFFFFFFLSFFSLHLSFSPLFGFCVRSSVAQYSDCVQPLFTDCGRHVAQALASVRILKEQLAVQCDKGEHLGFCVIDVKVDCVSSLSASLRNSSLSSVIKVNTLGFVSKTLM